MKIQLFWAIVLSFLGVALIAWGMYTPPVGIIDSSVLVAFGELLTFSGSIVGIDYHYKSIEKKKK